MLDILSILFVTVKKRVILGLRGMYTLKSIFVTKISCKIQQYFLELFQYLKRVHKELDFVENTNEHEHDP